MGISSLEFSKRLNNLERLQPLDNQYQCSLKLLASFENLRRLYVKSDAPTVFTEIPPLNTVKELTLNGAGAPDKDYVTQYLEWDNLERLAFYTFEDPDNYRVNVDALRRFSEVENTFENIIREKIEGIGPWGFEDNVFVNSYGIQ